MILKRILLFLICLPAVAGTSYAQERSVETETAGPPAVDQLIHANEYLKFKVTYSFFKIAWVEIEAIGDTLVDGEKLFHIRSTIRSNSAVPLIGTEIDEYNSIFYVNGQNLPVTRAYWKHDIDEGDYREYDYYFDRNSGQVRFRENATSDTLRLEEPATSGHLILLWARLFAGTDKTYRMNVYTAKEKGTLVSQNFTGKEKKKVAAFDNREVDTYYSRGSALVAGPFGFSGDFEIWFMDNELRVPVEARLKVFLGHVKAHLIEYRRGTG
ncbi:MAG: DUF3108 domain-containing protein [Balneolaceae bacterium]|nr:DUF3108 domain-containing protein [Balneolaceae bacterium]